MFTCVDHTFLLIRLLFMLEIHLGNLINFEATEDSRVCVWFFGNIGPGSSIFWKD